jgi:hypothetical protein
MYKMFFKFQFWGVWGRLQSTSPPPPGAPLYRLLTAGKRTPPVPQWLLNCQKRGSEGLIPLCVFGTCHRINLSFDVSALPAESATPQQHAELPRRYYLSFLKNFIPIIHCQLWFWQWCLFPSLPPPPFANFGVWVYVAAVFNLFSHDKTRWPSQKIRICCWTLMVTQTSFLASSDASVYPSFCYYSCSSCRIC